MTLSHHPSEGLLAAYATGFLGEGASLIVAAHLTLCPHCRSAVDHLEALGGALLEEMEPLALAEGALDAVLARLDTPAAPSPTRATASRLPPPVGEAALLPAPLRRHLADPSAATLPWRAIAPGIRQIPLLPRTADGGNAHLLKIAAKTALPHHGHHGREYTLVLSGAFQDCSERFARGDVAEVEADRVHRPITDRQDCLCLVVTEGPLRYMGIIPRLMQPFTGF